MSRIAMESILGNALEAFNQHSGWIIWNLFLAFIPLALSFWLYRRRSNSRSVLWWTAFIVFIAFLPNAPYLLTDIIHLIRATRSNYSAWIIALVFIPLHLFAILSGFQAYVISVMNQGDYLKRQGVGKYVLLSELITHAVNAIGVYLGRFRRFNSWDLVTDPSNIVEKTFDDLTAKRPLLVIVITFVIITIFYWLVKQITLGILFRIRYARLGKDGLE